MFIRSFILQENSEKMANKLPGSGGGGEKKKRKSESTVGNPKKKQRANNGSTTNDKLNKVRIYSVSMIGFVCRV